MGNRYSLKSVWYGGATLSFSRRSKNLTTGIAVLSNDPAVTRARSDSQSFRQQILKSGRVEGATGANNPLLRESRQFPSYPGENVARIGGDEEHRVGTVLDQLRYDLLENVDVALDQIEPGFTLLLAHTGCHDDHTGALRRRVVCARVYRRIVQKHTAVLQIKHFPFEPVGHHVYQYYVARDSLFSKFFC